MPSQESKLYLDGILDFESVPHTVIGKVFARIGLPREVECKRNVSCGQRVCLQFL
jgi:hypothetical protein